MKLSKILGNEKNLTVASYFSSKSCRNFRIFGVDQIESKIFPFNWKKITESRNFIGTFHRSKTAKKAVRQKYQINDATVK